MNLTYVPICGNRFSKYSFLPYGKVGNLILDEADTYRAFMKKNFWEMATGIRCAWACKS